VWAKGERVDEILGEARVELSGIEQYRATDGERARTCDLVRLLPRGRRSVLDIGARDGHFSRLLTEHFPEVTALDLKRPRFEIPGVLNVEGDVTALQFEDNSFDCVFCAEVLEHVRELETACAEIIRVARHEILLGVPFEQDIRAGRTTCGTCGKPNPPWGHVNSFDEKRILSLFPALRVGSKSFVGTAREATNALSVLLMDLAGNPWGTYDQEEPCIYCGAKLTSPREKRMWQRVCSAIAVRINDIQSLCTKPHGTWIHLVLSKD
jgi:SAM-dependent methyltransferase